MSESEIIKVAVVSMRLGNHAVHFTEAKVTANYYIINKQRFHKKASGTGETSLLGVAAKSEKFMMPAELHEPESAYVKGIIAKIKSHNYIMKVQQAMRSSLTNEQYEAIGAVLGIEKPE